MRIGRLTSLSVALALVAGMVLTAMPAQAQVGTNLSFRFAGTAAVAPGIFIPGIGPNNGPWTWSFTSDIGGCNVTGTSKGTPVSGGCELSGQGDLLPDLLSVPACGNSRGFSKKDTPNPGPGASFDDGLREWKNNAYGGIHWDGVLAGDPSYSLGSQLLLMGTLNNGSSSVDVVLFLNASGGSPCLPGGGGGTGFTVNGVGTLTS